MNKQAFNAMYAFNIVIQSFFSLITPAAVGFGISYLLVRFLSVGEWVYVPLILIGFLSGLISMIRFITSAMAGIERLEREQSEKKNKR